MKQQCSASWVFPDWPAPKRVRAVATTREGGVSRGPYASLNLGSGVGDDPEAVDSNRALLARRLSLPIAPLWLTQVHGKRVVNARNAITLVHADASISDVTGIVCSVTTADCLPVLLCDRQGTCVAAAHAGWRGLAAGILEATVQSMTRPAEQLLAWLGPAIGPQSYEVGDEVRQIFIRQNAADRLAFTPSANHRWLADLYQLARNRLGLMGVARIYGGDFCTYSDTRRFFSYRRDGATGRMASLIWID